MSRLRISRIILILSQQRLELKISTQLRMLLLLLLKMVLFLARSIQSRSTKSKIS